MRRRKRNSGKSAGGVVLSVADIKLVADALTDRLPVAIVDIPEEPKGILEILRLLGGRNLTENIRRAAIALSGTSNLKSRAYLSSRRRIERNVAAETSGSRATEKRRATPKGLMEIGDVIRHPHLSMKATITLALTADVIVPGQTRRMPAGGPQVLRPDHLATVRAKLRNGEELAAARALLDEWVYLYGLNTERDADGIIGNIETIDLEVIE